jgi:hypothetical protein
MKIESSGNKKDVFMNKLIFPFEFKYSLDKLLLYFILRNITRQSQLNIHAGRHAFSQGSVDQNVCMNQRKYLI